MSRPPYSAGIFMPKHPRSAKPLTYSSGIRASRSMTLPSTVSRNSRSSPRNLFARASSASDGFGKGCIRSSGKRPRNNSFAKDGLSQPLSRDSSATALACSSVTCACSAIAASSLETSRMEYPKSGTSHVGALGVELPGHRLDDLGDPASRLAVRVAAFAQLGLHGALQQRDHVLDHAVQLVGTVLVLGRHRFAARLGEAGRRLNQLEAQSLRAAPAGSDTEFHLLGRLEPLDPSGQRRRADVHVLAVLL